MTIDIETSEACVIPGHSAKSPHPLHAEGALDSAAFSKVRRRLVLDSCKWDPQVGDISTLAPFVISMSAATWRMLALWAEQLFAEASIAEEEVLHRPELLKELGLPRKLVQVLSSAEALTPTAARITRFDFHFTTGGWKISEANSDVPGGFAESSDFTAMMAEHHPHFPTAGNPRAMWVSALAAAAGQGGAIGLLSAPGYMEDHQVVASVAGRLNEIGCSNFTAKPEQIHWENGVASLKSAWHCGPLAAIVRFYQAEWMSRLPAKTDWRFFFRGGKTPIANPAAGIISESKRFPLVWDRLSAELPTWRALLPETRDPRRAPWKRDDTWLIKTAMCNTGDAVNVREWMKPADWFRAKLEATLSPSSWLAQRRFESVPVATCEGPRHVCMGIYVIDGKAAGIYGRLSGKPIIDYAAVDAAVLIRRDD